MTHGASTDRLKLLEAQPGAGSERTWSKQPPAVLLVCGALAVVAVSLRLVEARFAVHLEAVFRTILRRSGAVFGQVAAAGRLSAHASSQFELRV